jgi:RNA polymerase sigma-70 factor (ECF subfamily)
MAVNELSTYAGALTSSARESEEWAERARSGDDAAFRSIFDRYADPVFNFIYRMTGRRDLAEDLAQETFVRAYRKLPELRLRPDVKLSTWLFAIAKNVARESLRSRSRDQQRVALADESVAGLCDKDPRPDDRLLGRELDLIVRDALQALDADKRMVFTLRVIQQRSYEEITAITGFSLPKVKADIFRARAEMKRLLRPYLETGNEM